MIHVFGDSHVSMFSGIDERALEFPNSRDTHPMFKTYDMGSVLAYNFIDKVDLFTEWVDKYQVNRILLCLGEIDVRFYSVRMAYEKNKTISDIVLETVLRYLEGVSKVKELVDELIIFAPHPQRWHSDGILKDFHYGTYDEIYEAGLLFTKYLKENKPKDIIVCSIFSKMMEQKINKQSDFYMDEYHLKASKCLDFILDSLKEEGVQL
jgi:hypothetical protein